MSEAVLRKIFLAEDDEDDCEMFEEAIQIIDPTIQLTIFTDGEKIMEALRTGDAEPCMIFLDLNMPRKSGAECVTEIRSIPDLAEVPVIILTTSSNDNDINKLRQDGANRFVVKPNRHSRLIEFVKMILEIDWTKDNCEQFLLK